MSKLLSYMIPGIVLAIILILVNGLLLPDSLHSGWFSIFMSILVLACIIVPCVIYFIKLPPGRGAKP